MTQKLRSFSSQGDQAQVNHTLVSVMNLFVIPTSNTPFVLAPRRSQVLYGT